MIGDQYGNTVDQEIRVPIKDFHGKTAWEPLGKNSWIEKVETYGTKDGSQKPQATSEWAIAHCDGTVSDPYRIEDVAKFDLGCLRDTLRMCRVPEEYWPILMERTVETTTSSWRILSE